MTSATAGLRLPWDLAPEPDAPVELYTLVVDAAGDVVADCGIIGRTDDENERHARIAHAAPRMLELLESIENDAGQVPGWLWDRIQALLAEIPAPAPTEDA